MLNRLVFAVAAIAVSSAVMACEPRPRELGLEVYGQVSTFLSGLSGNYVYADNPVFKSFAEAVSGPPDEPLELNSGHIILSACRHRNCDEKGAVAVRGDGSVGAVALIHFACHRVYEKSSSSSTAVDCESSPRLTIFIRRSFDAELLKGEMEAWASPRIGGSENSEIIWLRER